jgi:hypothetical protein
MKIGKPILSALLGSLGFCAIGIFVYLVLLPALALIILAGATHTSLSLNNPETVTYIILFSLTGGLIGYFMHLFRNRKKF